MMAGCRMDEYLGRMTESWITTWMNLLDESVDDGVLENLDG
jgi:hypothetical protein